LRATGVLASAILVIVATTNVHAGSLAASAAAGPDAQAIELSNGWALTSANSVYAGGALVSQPGYDVSGWYPVTLPSTVMAGLVANGVYSNIYYDTNLQAVPDLTTQEWWYRGEFTAPAAGTGQQYWLRFKGIAYKAHIWLNGAQIDSNAIGTLVNHEYNVTGLIRPGAVNALALRITPPASGGTNLSFWYVDWNPKPPDMNAGIWGKVLLDTSGPVVLRDPCVNSVLPLPAIGSADLTVYVDAANGSSAPVTGVLSGQIAKAGFPTITFSQDVTLAANQRLEIAFAPASFPQLHVSSPALWWPLNMGSPELYELQLTFTVDGQQSDVKSTDFGIRQFTDYITPSIYGHTYRGYRVNGQNVLIRGADYVWDMLIRTPSKINEAHMKYVKDMGLNLVRFEGVLGNEEIYDLADRYGIMLMPGYVCCTYWAEYGAWTPQDLAVANASTESQMRLLRAHPSALVWAYGSDELPPGAVLTGWKSIASRLHWQNPTLDNVASYNNAGGSVPKMNGPYAWEPPVYWYADTARGGAFGFCAEQGGESVPPEETLRRFMSPSSLWPIGTVYGYHSGPSPFDNLSIYSLGINNRYGSTSGITQYADRAQLLNYEAERAQFEAFGANAYTLAQGTVYWMLNNAWPSVHWNLYDYYFKPGGGYFGTKKALEPIHILYDYQTRNVKVFNATLAAANGLTASVGVYNIPDLTLKHSNQVTMSFPANASTPVFAIPSISGLTTTYFIRLRLSDAGDQVVSDNLYWYSTSPDVLGTGGDWYYTNVASYANLSGLNSLGTNTSVIASASRSGDGATDTIAITLHNTSATNVAFFLRPEIAAGPGGLEVVPITYSDNYVTLFPGESTTITARYANADLGGQEPYLRVRGYNVPAIGSPVVGVDDGTREGSLRLRQNSPNPFGTRTTIGFDLERAAQVRLAIYDLGGRLVRRLVSGRYPAGAHGTAWDGRDSSGRRVASGNYLARLEAGGKVEVVRMGLVR
jgi:exo-1,4-beta-D-glucosaminidase